MGDDLAFDWRVYMYFSRPIRFSRTLCGPFKNLWFSCRWYFKVSLSILLASSPPKLLQTVFQSPSLHSPRGFAARLSAPPKLYFACVYNTASYAGFGASLHLYDTSVEELQWWVSHMQYHMLNDTYHVVCQVWSYSLMHQKRGRVQYLRAKK